MYPSSISSSDVRDVCVDVVDVRPHARWSAIAAVWRKCPRGGLAALVIAAVVHLLVVGVMVPQPVARHELRRQIMALTEHTKPRLLLAGDSRARMQLMPSAVAETLGISVDEVINMAGDSCEPAVALAAYREFSDRFAHRPIMVLSVSIFGVNDRAAQPGYVTDEFLWSIPLKERFAFASPVRVLRSCFLAERQLGARLGGLIDSLRASAVAERGFRGIPADNTIASGDDWLPAYLSKLDTVWFNDAVLDGIRWRQFEADVRALRSMGVQVVLFDGPEHPAFLSGIEGTEMGRAYAQFHDRLRALAVSEGIVLLEYGPSWCDGNDPDALFFNLLHVNRTGAALLSARVANDVRQLLNADRLRWPGVS